MNTKKIAAMFKRQLEMAKTMKAVSEQQMITATRLESEATTALEELGVSKGQARKGKFEFKGEQLLNLRANLTK